MKTKVILLCVLTLFSCRFMQACDIFASFCIEATQTNNDKIVVGTITNSLSNNIELTIIDVLFGLENNSTITIWDGATFECNGPFPNNANDMGSIGDTILCIIEPILTIENPWDVIGEYRRPNSIGGFANYTNFSIGMLFDFTYSYNEVLLIDMANYCCDNLSDFFYIDINGLPISTGNFTPITLSGFPAGGTFSGPGVVFNAFNPSLAGSGNHTIVYTIDDEFGCSFSTQKSILVFTLSFNFVNYNLGTISPKINNELTIEIDIPEQDEYTFTIFDLNGRQLHSKVLQLETGTHLQNIQLNQNLPNGIYLFNIFNSEAKVSKKFMISD